MDDPFSLDNLECTDDPVAALCLAGDAAAAIVPFPMEIGYDTITYETHSTDSRNPHLQITTQISQAHLEDLALFCISKHDSRIYMFPIFKSAGLK